MMKKNEIYQILNNMELTDTSRLEVDKVLGLVPDEADVPADKVETVMDIVKLEVELEDVNIKALDQAITNVDKASADLDTLNKTTMSELTALESQQTQEENEIDEDLKYLEDLATKANTTPTPAVVPMQQPNPTVQPQPGV